MLCNNWWFFSLFYSRFHNRRCFRKCSSRSWLAEQTVARGHVAQNLYFNFVVIININVSLFPSRRTDVPLCVISLSIFAGIAGAGLMKSARRYLLFIQANYLSINRQWVIRQPTKGFTVSRHSLSSATNLQWDFLVFGSRGWQIAMSRVSWMKRRRFW